MFDVTRILSAIEQGDGQAAEEVMPVAMVVRRGRAVGAGASRDDRAKPASGR